MPKGSRRVECRFGGQALKELEELRTATGLPTDAALVREAPRLFWWMHSESKDHSATFLIEKGGETRQISYPFWGSKNTIPFDYVKVSVRS